MPEELPTYTGEEICGKCGSASVTSQFVEDGEEYPAGLLRLRCSGCGFGSDGLWLVLTKDAPPPPPS